MVTPRKQPPSASKQPLDRPAPDWAASAFHTGFAKSPMMSPRPRGHPIQTKPMSLVKRLEASISAPKPWPAAPQPQLRPPGERIAAVCTVQAPPGASSAANQLPATQPDSQASQPQQPLAAGAGADAGTAGRPKAGKPASAAKPQPLVCYSISQVSEPC